jgi:hypothetical protein
MATNGKKYKQSGYVYLFLEVDIQGNEAYKIGITKNNPEKRIKQLQTGNSNKLSVLKSYQSPNYLKVEQWLHRKYSIKTEAGNEFRHLTDEEVMSFLDDCKKADETITFMKANNPFYK